MSEQLCQNLVDARVAAAVHELVGPARQAIHSVVGLGKDHPSVATSCNNLAALYQDQGKYGEAEPLY
ncbi:MAG: tetratricopeptide repeat protein [Desulfatibacillum sp.]|nr:tetratricopeptide repeat protein [Desulfatibacillum sp.]